MTNKWRHIHFWTQISAHVICRRIVRRIQLHWGQVFWSDGTITGTDIDGGPFRIGDVSEEALDRWLEGGLAQAAFPGMSTHDRELLISGVNWCQPSLREVIAGATRTTGPRTVTCAWCGGHFRSVVPSEVDVGTQGDGCACNVWRGEDGWFLMGNFGSGSSYDGFVFRFIQNPPTQNADPVCDTCTKKKIEAGDLLRIGGSLP